MSNQLVVRLATIGRPQQLSGLLDVVVPAGLKDGDVLYYNETSNNFTLNTLSKVDGENTIIRLKRNSANTLAYGELYYSFPDRKLYIGNPANNLVAVAGDYYVDLANSIFLVANLGFAQANTAYARANTGVDIAVAGYNQANTARDQANTARDQANNGYTQANIAYNQANTAYNQANTAYVQANAAYSRANVAYDQANAAYSVANAAYSAANVAFVQGNTAYTQANTARDQANTAYNQANTAYVQANTARDQANTAYTQGNTAYNQANTGYNQANAAYSRANVAYDHANAAYARANTKLDLVGGTISGDLVITGNVTVSGQTSYANTVQLLIGDNILTLNADLPAAFPPSENAGLEVNRGSSANVALLWNEGVDAWSFTNNGTNYFTIPTNTAVETATTIGQNAFNQANTGYLQANTARDVANLAFARANAALPNVSGSVFAGDLIVSGNITSTNNITSSNNIVALVDVIATRNTVTGNITANGSLTVTGIGTANVSTNLTVGGNVGIGITSPTSNLHVIGTANITSNLTVGRSVFIANGTPQSPSYSFTSQTSTGIYLSGLNELTIAANGVDVISFDDSTTDNLIEAIDANSNVVFSVSDTGTTIIKNDLEINSSRSNTSSNSQFVLASFSANTYQGGKFFITGKTNTNSHITEVLLTHNGANTFWTEYATIYSNTELFTVSSDLSSNNVRLLVTPTSNTNTTFKIVEQRIMS